MVQLGGFQEMERYTKRIICICLCCLIIALNIKVARAEAVPDVMCGSATVADCVMSYYAMSGAAVANTDWINTLYNDLGSNFGTIYDFAENGMLTLNGDGTWQATSALETAIENAPAYQSLGLDEVFNVTSAEVAAGGGLAVASGGSILGGALGCTASVGVLPLLGGVTAAYWGGIAIGTIAAHLLGLYDKNIYNGEPLTLNNNQIAQIIGNASSFGRAFYKNNSNVQLIYSNDNVRLLWLGYKSGTTLNAYIFAYNDQLANQTLNYYYCFQYDDGTNSVPDSQSFNLNENGVRRLVGGSYYKDAFPLKLFDSEIAYNRFVDGLLDGTNDFPKIYSPDLIGANGNLNGEKDQNGKIIVPDLLPQIDPSVQSGQPLSLSDWLNFANSAHQNTSTGALPDNSALFDNLLDLVKKAIPNPNPNPNPNPDPYTPPNPTPSPDPDYDPNPDNPNQPDYESEREGQTEPVPDSVPTGAPWITDGLLDKFPFCIPKDMIDMVKNFSSGTRQAPYISWRFNPPNTPVDYTFNLDLSDFEEVATLLRLLELGVFIVGLAFATRYLIGAT